ncbi:HAD-IIA family hydrolase [Nesterenkonia alkaliphila]|uniref:HAD-IIA family hydrolase n=1 Tax=Nesterenkonia alkaliphila TaxID=1463631 RepID=A0A7K1UJ77_9MICC|nr:HAD-IIA family hydrolase [Nesterenkonia alkaliphila]MVT26533.1 HAD-IIA family hydrolase [Nesterenkonia alkaliphila]GFZ79095.1 haloacid dehalogenase [Nesterenkonia alkaliphila]
MSGEANIECWLTDMDGVLVREHEALPGAAELLEQWRRRDLPYLVLTNNSIFTARDLSARLRHSGLVVPEDRIWTSALATATFLAQQVDTAHGSGSAYVVGEAGLTTALHEAGFIMTETDPDYVVVGETRNYSFEAITKAVRLISNGARFIVTNPDATGPSPEGMLPATGAIAALISKATGSDPYVVGKPNPMMFRSALNHLGAHSMQTAMIGDRMDTDIVAGMEAGMHTILVMSGVSSQSSIAQYPFRPNQIIDGVYELVEDFDNEAASD